MLATDWVTVSALATAAGTLVLAVATFASVRSANRAARTAELTLLAGLRPLLLPSRLEDPAQKVSFIDDRTLIVGGGEAAAECNADTIYLAASLRNVGSGIAVLHGWRFYPERRTQGDPPDPDELTRLTRDLYIAAGEVGFWQGSFRDPSAAGFGEARATVEAGGDWTIDLLYGDAEGGQRIISRYGMVRRPDGGWIAQVGRHWNVDRDDPR